MTQVATRPIVTGPVTGGRRGWPFGASMLDVSAYGYTEAEYLLEGAATRYRLAPGADLGVPVFVVNSELEAIACYPVRQTDTATFRYWESAGTCHVSAQGQRDRRGKFVRDEVRMLPLTDGINRIPMIPLYDAAFRHMHRWLNDGTPPPSQPKVEFAGEPSEVVRDEHGIAKGGIRLPQADVPLAQNSAIPLTDDIFAYLGGSSHAFAREKIHALHGDKTAFLAKFETAAKRAVAAGVLLPRDVAPLIAEADETWPV